MTKHGSTALGLNTHSSSSSSSLGWAPFSRLTKESNPGSSLSTTSGSDPTRPAMTRHTSMARLTCMNLNSSSISSGTAAWARQPEDCVEIPSILGENPVLMIPQTLQYWLEHMPEAPPPPFSPKSHRKVAQWNLKTGFEYDLDNVVAGIPIHELRYRVLYELVLLEKIGGEENLAAEGTRVDIVPERNVGLVGADIAGKRIGGELFRRG
nr:hypothetical protein Csa_6G187400 [Ipomoea batatas]